MTLVYIVTGVMLVWNRPSVMLWGLAVLLIGTQDFVFGPFSSPIIAALLIFGFAFISTLCLPGLIVFAARFPYGRANSATKVWDITAVGTFLLNMPLTLYGYLPLFTARPLSDRPDFTHFYSSMYVAILIALCLKLRKNHAIRNGFGWIVAGYGVGFVLGYIGLSELFSVLPESYLGDLGQLVLMLAFPASVAYSLIRHRSFDLGHLTNRTLVLASLSIGVVATFLIGVWVTSVEFSSTLGVGSAMFVALLIGMTFQAQHGRAINIVDRIFLPRRYEVGVSLDRIRETLRGSNDAKRVTADVAGALGLASVAVFERASDGGFVRNAACGWPHGTIWHLLPGEALTRSLGDGATVITLPDELAENSGFPSSHACPRVALTIRRGGRVERAVLIGHCSGGASLDRDAIRSVHGIFDDALIV